MTDITMVERVARAIEPRAFDEAHFHAMSNYTTQYGDFERGKERALAKARAAIEAMREPDAKMLLAWTKFEPWWDHTTSPPTLCYPLGSACWSHWHAGIDAALAEAVTDA